MFRHGIYHEQTMMYHVYTTTNGFAMLFYVHAALEHVQAMYETGTYIKCTNLPVFVHIS